MSRLILLVAAVSIGLAAPSFADANLVSPSCWQAFAPRAVSAPRSVKIVRAGDARLTLASGGRRFVYGGWRCAVDGIEAGRYYRMRAEAVAQNVASVGESLTVLLRWKGDFGPEVAPSYVWDARRAGRGGAILYDSLVQAPPKARAVDVELVLQWSATGRVTWGRVALVPASPPAPRAARVAAVWFRPRGAKNGAEAVAQAAAHADAIAAEHKPDVVLLGEVVNHVGTGATVDADAEPIPGPTTERFAALARRHSTYVALGVLERSGADVFNAAVLIDRRGRIVGKYRKVQLPLEEVSAGEAPGDSFPVFEADFGKVGLLICHDTSFVEPARVLALGGAELVLVPIWGGRTPLVRARAIENGVYVATSGYDYASEIVDPSGAVIASAPRDGGPGAAVADIDFNRTYAEDWIGNWRDTVNKQRRFR